MPVPERRSVLYVDDEPGNLRVFELNFRDRYHVLVAPSGERGLELLSEHQATVGVLLTDQRMPGMSGVELMERAAVMAPEAARMVITAYSDVDAVLDAINRGQVSRYFLKPWNRVELGVALDDAFRQREALERARALELQLLRSSGLLTLGELSAGVAHELLNPIGYIQQNLASLRRELEVLQRLVQPQLSAAPEELREALAEAPALLQELETGAHYLRDVSSRLKETARGVDANPLCDLETVAHFSAKLARAGVGSGTRFTVNGPAVEVRCGSVRLIQVLLNLFINAAYATADAGRPGLVAMSWSLPAESDASGDRLLALSVQDNGCGIPAELTERIFEPLVTTRKAGCGTGLGLGLCRQLLRQVGGDVAVASTSSEGTTFTVRLPLA